MKKKGILLIILGALLFIGCSKNSDEPDQGTQQVDKRANLLATGASANDLLSNDRFTRLKIEIAYVAGFRPTTLAMAEFMAYLKLHTFKEEIELVFNELPSPGEESLTLQKIADLESENRTVFNDGETLGVYIYFADAPSDEDDDAEGLVTLGAVYRNTSMVIHEITVRRLSNQNGPVRTSDVEAATINHEFGHLFGLVDLGSTMVNDHEDPNAVNHCNVQGCLMRAELQFGGSGKSSLAYAKASNDGDIKAGCSLSGASVLQMLQGSTAKNIGSAPGIDPECILDLVANGGR